MSFKLNWFEINPQNIIEIDYNLIFCQMIIYIWFSPCKTSPLTQLKHFYCYFLSNSLKYCFVVESMALYFVYLLQKDKSSEGLIEKIILGWF